MPQKTGSCPGLACPQALFGDLACVRCPHNPGPEAYPQPVAACYVLPWPPSVNRYWRHVNIRGRGHCTLISADGRAYKRAVGYAVLEQCAARKEPLKTLTGRLAVSVLLHPPDRRARDIDNSAKSVLDALTSAKVWRDDEQVDRLELVRGTVISGGCAEVTIREIPQEMWLKMELETRP